MSKSVAYKRGKKGWINSDHGGGLCFTLTYDRLEQMLREHNLPISKIAKNEQIERVEINNGGITVFIEPKE